MEMYYVCKIVKGLDDVRRKRYWSRTLMSWTSKRFATSYDKVNARRLAKEKEAFTEKR